MRGGRRLPTLPLAVAGGMVVLAGVIAYLVLQSGNGTGASGPEKAAADSSASIPGTYVADQGQAHLAGDFSLGATPVPFCPGVKWSGAPEGQPSPTPAADGTPAPTGSPAAPVGCWASNPPSSGSHLGTQRNVDVGNGNLINIPPDPDVYPPDVVIPRDAIAHVAEHAGVFVGYNCADGDSACEQVVQQLTDIVNKRIDRNDNSSRVVMSRDPDLVAGTIGMSSWTRVLTMSYQDFNAKTADDFIAQNSCRVDWESACQ